MLDRAGGEIARLGGLDAGSIGCGAMWAYLPKDLSCWLNCLHGGRDATRTQGTLRRRSHMPDGTLAF